MGFSFFFKKNSFGGFGEECCWEGTACVGFWFVGLGLVLVYFLLFFVVVLR